MSDQQDQGSTEPADVHDDREDWDAIVVGTGMGGGMAGRRLTEQGLRVLFLEKGDTLAPMERQIAPAGNDPTERQSRGLWPDLFGTSVDDIDADLSMSIGCGVGGSTLLYAAALERLARDDIDATGDRPHPTGGWPIAYDELVPYYRLAERWLRVHGTTIPGENDAEELLRPPPMRASDAVLMQDMAAAGLAPYRLHVGIAYKPGCKECLGVPCPIGCKSDSKTCGVDPALGAGATLVTGADVVRLEADATRVTGLIYRRAGKLHRVRAPIVILAAGTMRSAPLLLGSRSAAWPEGIANRSGVLGRNLMFHVDNWFAIWPSRKAEGQGPTKTIGSRQLYRADGLRLGMIQATGLSAGYGNILTFLYNRFDASRWRALRPARPFLRVPAKVAEKLFGTATILTMLVEDLPYLHNRLELDAKSPSGVRVHYRTPEELRTRARASRSLLKRAFPNSRLFWLSADALINWGHPMGTCRFGNDPASSVLDRDCKAHGIDNLYVVDGSFMPTGGGVNPSLTIAANAIRVADRIGEQFASSRRSSAQADPTEQLSL
jgi:choline dehydrogenase-like flavoprotein